VTGAPRPVPVGGRTPDRAVHPRVPDPVVDVLVIGHLSRNKFWGEPDDRACREALCTSTLIRSGGRTVLVDPGCPPQEMAPVLDRRAGLAVADVDAVFLTHFHADHRVGIAAFEDVDWYLSEFEDVDWYLSEPEIRAWQGHPSLTPAECAILGRTIAAPPALAPGVELLATPGHTPGHTSLLVRAHPAPAGGSGRAGTTVVAGDAAPTRDFFFARDWFHNAVDPACAVTSVDLIAARADAVVPGHDNWFAGPRRVSGGAGADHRSAGSTPSTSRAR
jgi:glyoxylase-like metal-dependent hydrolase (beta-lactamase superfamily II)